MRRRFPWWPYFEATKAEGRGEGAKEEDLGVEEKSEALRSEEAWDYIAERPGDLVEAGTLDVRPFP